MNAFTHLTAAALGVAAEEIEWCIHHAQANQNRNQWAGTPPSIPLVSADTP
jgi:hypothetical protein